MISQTMQDALNDQVNAEFYSAFLYLSMSSYFSGLGLGGFAKWMEAQYREEESHAMKIYAYILERGGRAVLKTIEAPQLEWESPLDAFEAALGHERKVSGLINELVNQAIEEKDHATNIFLQWFVSEQVEEEDSVGAVVDQIKLTGKEGNGLFFLDRELGQRVFTLAPE